MASNFPQFRQFLRDAWQKVLPGRYVEFQKQVAAELLTRVVNKTPVDTGRARGNWQLDIGRIPPGSLETLDTNGASTIARGLAKLPALRRGSYQTIYIVNNLPYAESLENGRSQQAPSGMLAVSIAEVEAIFDRVE